MSITWDIAGAIIILALCLVGLARWMIVRMDKSFETLHRRINDVKEDYVRRDDLDMQIAHIVKTQDRMYDEQREHAKTVGLRFDAVMHTLTQVTALIKNGSKGNDHFNGR